MTYTIEEELIKNLLDAFQGKVEARPEFALAVELARHLSIALGIEDGEDSAGRQKFRLLSAPEVAKRACDISFSMFYEAVKRGWIDLSNSKQKEKLEE